MSLNDGTLSTWFQSLSALRLERDRSYQGGQSGLRALDHSSPRLEKTGRENRMPRRNWWCLISSGTLIAALVAGGGPALEAQTTDPDTPASSPLWWTLTDDVSPQELRQSFRDRKGNLQHYLEALEKGLAAPHPPEQLEYLSYFHSGALHPELLPMWEAFDTFATGSRYHAGWDVKAAEGLRTYGISAAGIEIILPYAYEALARQDRLIQEIGDEQREFIALTRKAAEVLGDQAVRMAMKHRKAEVLAQAANRPLDQVRKLMSSWEIDPTASTMDALLPQLKEALDEKDWQNLRRYLLHEVAPETSAIDFDYSEKLQ